MAYKGMGVEAGLVGIQLSPGLQSSRHTEPYLGATAKLYLLCRILIPTQYFSRFRFQLNHHHLREAHLFAVSWALACGW